MFAVTLSFALFGAILTLVVDVFRRDGAKVLAALEGRSWKAEPMEGRPVTIRFAKADWEAARSRLPELLAAA
ncbi:MAG TPA: hypothetical protein VFT40_10205 [Sphingomicrobium sp.]|nr:hypothetical protein [Sphingomicrobium sp.]